MNAFIKLFTLLLPIIFLSCSGGYEQPQKLHRNPKITMGISLNKDEYVEGEPIWLTAKFNNVGNKVDSLADLDEYAIYSNLKIESDSGLPVRYFGPVVDRLFPVYTKLQPRQVYDISVDVRQFWMNNYLGTKLFYGYITDGKYDVQSLYISGWSEDLLELHSQKLAFRVVKPSKVTTEALDSLINIFKSNYDWSKQLYGFYEMHPKSVYTEEAFHYYTRMRMLDYNKIKIDSSFLNECYDFLENYPGSYYKCDVLSKCLFAYQFINGKSMKNFRYYLNYMKQKFPSLTGCTDRILENETNLKNAMIWNETKK